MQNELFLTQCAFLFDEHFLEVEMRPNFFLLFLSLFFLESFDMFSLLVLFDFSVLVWWRDIGRTTGDFCDRNALGEMLNFLAVGQERTSLSFQLLSFIIFSTRKNFFKKNLHIFLN
jgi:hypothetical protein